jgi:3'-phosphoadenosine 5'-phosphosulfate sulfotransferase (PAPS reductase)/FAD synthetase
MKIFNSFSGGRSSGMMSRILKDKYPSAEIVTVFANTGQEHEKTLEFVKKCDSEFNLNVVWVEPVFNMEKGKGTTHRVVDFKTATRDSSLFAQMCKKYGIPNQAFPHCTRELKLQPMYSFIRSLGWSKGDYLTSIGIRADEIDRVNPNYKENNYIYPLIDEGVNKKMVGNFWEKQNFDLGLKDYQGNCVWCWKKSLKKLRKIYKDDPRAFNAPRELEEKYGHVNNKNGQCRVFFRGNMSTDEMIKAATEQIDLFEWADQSLGCEETCEAII